MLEASSLALPIERPKRSASKPRIRSIMTYPTNTSNYDKGLDHTPSHIQIPFRIPRIVRANTQEDCSHYNSLEHNASLASEASLLWHNYRIIPFVMR